MRKPDEIALYAYMRNEAAIHTTANTNNAASALGIDNKRAHDLVEKWRDHWWCDGVSTRCVYFLPEAPNLLLPWGVQ